MGIGNNAPKGNRIRDRMGPAGISRFDQGSQFPFYLLLLYLFFEYGRPQVLLPFLSYLHLPAIIVVLLTLFILFSGKFQMRDNQIKLFLLLLGFMVIHGPIAVNNYWALMIFITMSMNFIIFFSLVCFVDTSEKYDRLIKLWLGIHIFLAFVGIVNKGTGIGGFLGDENDFCMVLNMIIPFSFFLSMYSSGKKRIYYLILTGLFLFVIMLTGSRGGFVGLIATSGYCWFRTKRKGLTAFIVVFLAVFALLVAPKTYWDRVRSITEEGASAGTGEERVYTWKIGWHMFLDNPVIGVGQGNFPWVFNKYELEVTGSDEPFYGRSVSGRAAHSIYFTLLPELGILGTCIFIGMIIYTLKDLKAIRVRLFNPKHKGSNPFTDKHLLLCLALEGALVSYLVSGVFISILYYPNLWILMGFIISLKHIVATESRETSSAYAPSKNIREDPLRRLGSPSK